MQMTLAQLFKQRDALGRQNSLQNFFYWREEQKRLNKNNLAWDDPALATPEAYLSFMKKKGYKEVL